MVAVKEFGMFTDRGNEAVGALVNFARTAGLNWAQTYKMMTVLSESKYEEFGEVLDTEVRECVYSALGFDTDFYI
jgi:hypothetical protein